MRRHWFFNLVQGCAVAGAAYWWWHLPVPGYAIGVLAVLAALMSVDVDMRPWHKAIWMLLIGAFLVLEFRAINKDRTDFAKAEAIKKQDENAAFNSIVEGLKASIQQSENQFVSTMNRFDATTTRLEQVQRSEERTAKLANKNLEYATGGGEFCYLAAIPPSDLIPAREGRWPLFQGNSGDVPIPNCSVIIHEVSSPQATFEELDRTFKDTVRLTFSQVPPKVQGLQPTNSYILPKPYYTIRIDTPTQLFVEELRFTPDGSAEGYRAAWKVYPGNADKNTKPLLDSQ